MFSSAFDKKKPNEYNHNIHIENKNNQHNDEDFKNISYEANKLTKEIAEKLKGYESLILGYNFNSSIDLIPDNIKKITFEHSECECDITKLPSNLEILDLLTSRYEIKIENIPDHLKVLKFSSTEVEDFEYKIPEGLEILFYSGQKIKNFNETFSKLLNLKKLCLKKPYNNYYDFDFTLLPENLEILDICNDFQNINLNNLPSKLKKLSLPINKFNQNTSFDSLPASLEILNIESHSFEPNYSLELLPINLKVLKIICFNDYKCQSLNSLPLNLEFLNISIGSFVENQFILPPNLKRLKIVTHSSIDEIILPKTLINLEISLNNVNKNLILPESLLSLNILHEYSNHIDTGKHFIIKLPRNLKYLNVYDIDLINLHDVPNLETLIFSCKQKNKLKSIILPTNLKTLLIYTYLHKGLLPHLPETLENLYFVSNDMLPQTFNSNIKSLHLQGIYDYNFNILNNLVYFGFFPVYSKNQTKDNFNQFVQRIINELPDSIEIFATNIDINLYQFKKLPANLKEIGIDNRELTNSDFDYFKHFKSGGCTNDFDTICLYLVESGSDIKYFNRRVFNYFEKNSYLYDYDYDYDYDI